MPRNSKGGLGNGLGTLLKTNPLATKKEQGVLQLTLAEVHPNPEQPRRVFSEEELQLLADSIQKYGVVQPIVVVKQAEGYQIVAGERRWRASKMAGKTEIPAIIKDYSLQEITEIALIENLQRKNLDPIEEAYAYQKLQDTFKQTQETMAKRLGRSRSHIANMMRLLQLPAWLQERISTGELSVGQVRPLIGLDEEVQRKLVEQILTEDLSVRSVEALVKSLQETLTPSTKRPIRPKYTAEQRALEDRLRFHFGTKVSIKLKGESGTQGDMVIPFRNEAELGRILEVLQLSDE